MKSKFLSTTLLALSISMSPGLAVPVMAAEWSLPWGAGKTATVTQGSHYDGWRKDNNSIDFALPAGEEVLAPVDSTVINFCHAGNNHYSIYLSSQDGNYALSHVQTSGVQKGQVFKKGQKVGVVAGDKPWNACAQSTGSHIHLGFPSANLVVDGYRVGSMSGQVTSKMGQSGTNQPGQSYTGPVNEVNFEGTAAPEGVNIRSGPSTSYAAVGRLAPNQRVTFSGWVHGESIQDRWINKPDRRWYRIAGTNTWVASGVINGNAPGSQP